MFGFSGELLVPPNSVMYSICPACSGDGDREDEDLDRSLSFGLEVDKEVRIKRVTKILSSYDVLLCF